MAFSYLALAVALAASLNAANRFARAAGTLFAAFALVMLVVSIVMADFDGTFRDMPPPSSPLDPFKPLILNVQAVLAVVAAGFLFWAARLQFKRRTVKPAPSLNSASVFGLVSRYAHWITATLVLCLVPMGLFVSVLKAGSPDLPDYLAAHQSLGLTVLAVAALRLLWLVISPPPSPSPNSTPMERRLARAVHIGLYVLILAFPLSGFLISAHGGKAIEFYGWALSSPVDPGKSGALLAATAHDLILPTLFYVLIFAHVGAVLKHHVLDGRKHDIRRMLS